ncbi:hypothetical protein Tco_1283302 [Tanacetum coccineum]
MGKLAFCDYHNMVAILEKTEHNTDFHQIVDFLEASHIRVETVDEAKKIIATVNGRQRTLTKSSIRRHLKLNDAEVLADSTGSPSSTTVDQDAPSLSNSQTTPETEPPIILNNVEEDNHDIEVAHMDSEQRTHGFMHIYLAHASSSTVPTHLIVLYPEPLTIKLLMGKLTFCDYHNMVLEKTEHNTDFHQIVDFLEASHIRYALMVRPTVYVAHIQQFWSTARVETVDEATKIIAYGLMEIKPRGLRFSSKVPSPGADETASPLGDDKHGEAFPTATSLDAGQDRENLLRPLPCPMKHHQSLQRQHSLMEAKIQSQDLEITQLKTRIKTLEDNEKMREGFAQEDAPNTGGVDQGEDLVEKSTDKGSESTGVSPAVATASGSFPTAAVFTTASVATPRVTRSSRGIVIEPSSPISVNIPSISKKDKGKGIMTEPEKPSKEKVLDQMSAQLAKELEEEFALEDQRIREQAERDSEIVRIHAQQELDMMIAELDRSNEMVAKHLSEYEQAEAELSHNEKVELINELLKYQRDLAQIKKYQAQQSKLTTKTERRKFYTSVLRSSAGWKAKDFKGMTFDQIEEKFFPVWEKIQEFVPMDSKLESERLKRPGIQLAQKSSKKLKTAKASGSELSQEQQTKEPKELSEEELKKMMEIVPAEEVYIEALQVKRPIIDWEVYGEG